MRTAVTSRLPWLAAAMTVSLAFAQGPANPVFEVASVKPSDPSSHATMLMYQPGGRFVAKGVAIRMLLAEAYDVRESQLSGGPAWLATERYDITAKAETEGQEDPGQLSEDKRTAMMARNRLRLQALLADRFQVKVHRETKELPSYSLTIAKGGLKLRESAPQAAGSDSPRGVRMSRGQLSGNTVPMELLTRILSNQVGRPVIDKTGLTGRYDFTLEFTPEQGQQMGGPPDGPGSGDAPAPSPAPGPSIFTALQEQLGLRLESQKNMTEILVIDHAEKASEN